VVAPAAPRSESPEAVAAIRRRILEETLARVDELVERSVALTLEQIPAYARAAQRDPELPDSVRDQVRRNYRANLLALLEGHRPTLDDTAFVRTAAAARARLGIELEDYLAAYRIGHGVLWEALLEAGGDAPSGREAVLPLATPLMAYSDLISAHAGKTYAERRQFAVADADRERRDLVERVLAGELPADGPLAGVAAAYGIGAAAPLMVAVAAPRAWQLDADAAHAAGAALSRACRGRARVLVAARQLGLVAILSLAEGVDPLEICDALDTAHDRLHRDGLELALGVGTVADGVAEVPRAHEEAAVALAAAAPAAVVALPRLSAFDYLALRADDTARRLLDPRLREFLASDRRRGSVLTATIRAFAEADLNVRVAAERLQVHPNTAQYRLRRVRERTGRNPRRTSDLLDLLVAIALE